MRRKIIQLSPSTHVVSLPASWLREHNLQKGSDVHVEPSGAGLLVLPQAAENSGKALADVRGKVDDELWAMIDAAYLSGAQTIEIRAESERMEYLNKAVRYFPGLVISSERKGLIVCQDIAGADAATADALILRVHHMLADMISDGIGNYERREWSALSRIKYRDYVISSYVSYAIRQLFREQHRSARHASLLHALVRTVEEFGDAAVELLRSSVRKKGREAVLSQALEVARLCGEAYRSQDEKTLRRLFVLARKRDDTHPVIARHAFSLYELHLQLGTLAQPRTQS